RLHTALPGQRKLPAIPGGAARSRGGPLRLRATIHRHRYGCRLTTGRSAVHSFYTTLGRFAVRFRWAVVVAWVAAAVLANLFFPSLPSVAKQANAALLPAGSPSLQAARLAAPFQGINQTPVSVVVARAPGGALTAGDLAAVGRLEAHLATVA